MSDNELAAAALPETPKETASGPRWMSVSAMPVERPEFVIGAWELPNSGGGSEIEQASSALLVERGRDEELTAREALTKLLRLCETGPMFLNSIRDAISHLEMEPVLRALVLDNAASAIRYRVCDQLRAELAALRSPSADPKEGK